MTGEMIVWGIVIVGLVIGLIMLVIRVVNEERDLAKRMKSVIEQNDKVQEAVKAITRKYDVPYPWMNKDTEKTTGTTNTKVYGGARGGGKSHMSTSYRDDTERLRNDHSHAAIFAAALAASSIDSSPVYQDNTPTVRDCSDDGWTSRSSNSSSSDSWTSYDSCSSSSSDY